MTLSFDRTLQSPPLSFPPSLPNWTAMTWDEYEQWRNSSTDRLAQWYFDRGYFWVRDMGWEGMNHAEVKDLFILILSLWFMAHPEQTARSMSGGLLEKAGLLAASPDLLLYVESDTPQWEPGEPRRIDVDRWRTPNLVGEIADTTLASDLDEMKQIYAAMSIPEYWVIDVQGRRVLMFQLRSGKYQQTQESGVMPKMRVALLEEILARWAAGEGVAIGNWFMAHISSEEFKTA